MKLINKQTIKQFILSGNLLSPEKYLRKKGAKVGIGCHIRSCKINAVEGYLIEIGNYVRISQNVDFFTHGGLEQIKIKNNDLKFDFFGKIKIGDYTFIGEGVKIMPGVSIGSNVVVGAGSIVTKSIPDNCVVGGNPAKFISYTDVYYHSMKMFEIKTGLMSDEEKRKYLLDLPDEQFIHKSLIKTPK